MTTRPRQILCGPGADPQYDGFDRLGVPGGRAGVEGTALATLRDGR
jgi:hypothetical protein